MMEPRSLKALQRELDGCRACDLWRDATQAVGGEGAAHARMMLVGEQPGDAEDRQGAPFVGPAGQLLDRALAAAGVDRGEVYVTNAVKHFKWVPSGKRRLHKTPAQREIAACLDWLHEELALLKPAVVVCLGATAARAMLGPKVRVTVDRERTFSSPHAPIVRVTVHPSSLLRTVDHDEREQAMKLFVRDLAHAKKLL